MSDASYVETIIELRQALDDAHAEIGRLRAELAETEAVHLAAEHRAQTAEMEIDRLRAGIEALIKDYVDVFDQITEERSWTMTKAYLQRLLDGEPK